MKRRMPIGAEVVEQGVHFRIWAPQRRRIKVILEHEAGSKPLSTAVSLESEGNGYFSVTVPKVGPGIRYHFRLDGGKRLFPDPASRYQPDGPHGASQVIDPSGFVWGDADWLGLSRQGQVIYEMHIGTFTEEGTWQAATRELGRLAELGISVLELLPVADFSGRFGWGYDGVNLFAPTRLYGEPDDLRGFVNTAHALGLGVILDVVYNHLGPDGNYLKEFSTDYFTDRYTNEWGDAINFDGPNSAPVREYFVANAGYWIDEFHFDGLRIDASQNIYDASREHILAAISRKVRAAGRGRGTYITAENEPQQVHLLLLQESGGYDMDALWNDDFHHSAVVAMTGHNEAYYTDYLGKPQEFVSLAKRAYLYQGQHYQWQDQPRGTSTRGFAPDRFINFMENHDQIANSGRGLRVHMVTSPGRFRAMTALLLLLPATPLLFQGQEFAASTPFFYFADHREDLAQKVKEGRARFLAQFRSLALPEMQRYLPDPADPITFVRSKLNLAERELHHETWEMHRSLLALRREDPVFSKPREGSLDGAVLGAEAFVLRFFGETNDDRLLLVNFGLDLQLPVAPEPLLAAPRERQWSILWSSEDPRYGGRGTAVMDCEQHWWVPGHAAVVLNPVIAEAPHG